MKLYVLVSNLYNNEEHRADYYEAGDILVTSGSYGQELIRMGLAEIWTGNNTVPQEKPLPEIIPTAAFPDMETISSIGSLAPLLDVPGINLGHITTLVNDGRINDLSDLKGKPVDELRKLLQIPQASAKQAYKIIQGA